MITLRLDPELEQEIINTAKNLGVTKSELIRHSIQDYMKKIEKPNAWEIGRDVFGKYSSGKGNLSSKRKELIIEEIKAKRK